MLHDKLPLCLFDKPWGIPKIGLKAQGIKFDRGFSSYNILLSFFQYPIPYLCGHVGMRSTDYKTMPQLREFLLPHEALQSHLPVTPYLTYPLLLCPTVLAYSAGSPTAKWMVVPSSLQSPIVSWSAGRWMLESPTVACSAKS